MSDKPSLVASETVKQAVKDAGMPDVVWHEREGELVPFVPFSEVVRLQREIDTFNRNKKAL